MSIRNRLFVGVAISIVLVIVFVFTTLIFSSRITEKQREEIMADDLALAISDLNIVMYEYLMHHEKRMEEQWHLKYDAITEVLGKELTKSIRADYVTFGDLFLRVTRNDLKMQELIKERASQEEIDLALALEERLVSQLLITSQSIFIGAHRIVEEAHAEAAQVYRLARNLTLVLMIILAGTVTITCLLAIRSISKPLTELTKGAKTIGEGNLKHRIDIESRDEMGGLAASFNEMTGKLQESYISLEKEIDERKKGEETVQILNRELEQRLLELSTANKELEGFSYYVSHDLRVPLRAIVCFSEILLEDHGGKLDREGKRVLNVVRDNAERMERLIDDLLNFSHLGRKDMEKKSIDMYGLTKNIVKELKNNNPERKLKIKVNTLPFAYGDESLIGEVLINLLSNAIKFSKNEKSSVIEVGGRLEKDENIYYVKDKGVGFDMKYSDKLFGVFQRLHSQEEFKGTGVGLALVQRIIHRHGGRIWAEGKPDKGATFYFTIPLRKEKEEDEK